MKIAATISLRSSVHGLILACIAWRFQLAASHGRMVTPEPRQPEPLFWYQVGCMIGCTCSGGGKENYPSLESVACKSPAQPTNNKSEHLTWNIDSRSPQGDWNKYMPWRAPGTSKPLDPCGIASGFVPSASVQFPHKFANESIVQAMKGTDLPKGPVTTWTSGETVEASFTLTVNHGGGYQYRVCPTNKGAVDEACFEANPLKFADGMHRVRYLNRSGAMEGDEILLNATDVSEGVVPAGAAWRRLPMPSCNCDLGTACSAQSRGDFTKSYGESESLSFCTTGVQFDAPHLKDGTWPEGLGYYVAGIKPGYRTSGTMTKTPNDQKTKDSDGKHMLDWIAGFTDSTARKTIAEAGSTLVFSWPGNHDVYEMANEEALLNCNFTGAVLQGTSSPVMVEIPENATKGSQLFFSCSVAQGKHCQAGQYLTVNITDKMMTSNITDKMMTMADQKMGDGQAKMHDKDKTSPQPGKDPADAASSVKCEGDSQICKQGAKYQCNNGSWTNIGPCRRIDECNGCFLQSICYDPKKYSLNKGTCEYKGGSWNYKDDEEASYNSPRVDAGKESCTSFKNKSACQVESGCTWYSGKGGLCYEPAGYGKGNDDKTDFSGSDYGLHDDSSGDKAPGWVVVDKLIAPSEPGHYILQWRWDNEQTPQIWTTCADIEVEAISTTAAPTTPELTPAPTQAPATTAATSTTGAETSAPASGAETPATNTTGTETSANASGAESPATNTTGTETSANASGSETPAPNTTGTETSANASGAETPAPTTTGAETPAPPSGAETPAPTPAPLPATKEVMMVIKMESDAGNLNNSEIESFTSNAASNFKEKAGLSETAKVTAHIASVVKSEVTFENKTITSTEVQLVTAEALGVNASKVTANPKSSRRLAGTRRLGGHSVTSWLVTVDVSSTADAKNAAAGLSNGDLMKEKAIALGVPVGDAVPTSTPPKLEMLVTYTVTQAASESTFSAPNQSTLNELGSEIGASVSVETPPTVAASTTTTAPPTVAASTTTTEDTPVSINTDSAPSLSMAGGLFSLVILSAART